MLIRSDTLLDDLIGADVVEDCNDAHRAILLRMSFLRAFALTIADFLEVRLAPTS